MTRLEDRGQTTRAGAMRAQDDVFSNRGRLSRAASATGLVVALLLTGGDAGARGDTMKEAKATIREAQELTTRPHQPGQANFRSILPETIDWKPFAAFPPSVRLAVLVGNPSEPGPYVVRVKLPGGVKLMPHTHPEDRVYTVISGVFYIGLGTEFDPDKLEAYPPGAVIVLPGNTPHFHWAKSGDYVTQVNAIGPLGIEYLHPSDDPRKSER